MMRKWALICTLPALTAPLCAHALSLGDITVSSELNKPFKAEIPVLSASPAELSRLKVGLASSEDFAQAGMPRPDVLSQLRFKLVRKSNGSAYLKVTSKSAINEPILDYLLEASWPAGHVVREYTVLLDPPRLQVADQQQSPVNAPTAGTRITPDRVVADQPDSSPPPRVSYVRGGKYGPTRPGDTLGAIVNQVRGKGQTTAQVMLALLKTNPDAFFDHDINKLRVGYKLTVPEAGVVTALSNEQAQAELASPDTYLKQAPASPADAATPPQAPELIADAAPPAGQDSGQDKAAAAPQAADTADSTAKLKLLASDDTKASDNLQPASVAQAIDNAANAPAGGFLPVNLPAGELEGVKRDLALANETLEAKRQEDAELNSRLAVLESQMASMQRLITLKNEEVVSLQARLSDLQTPVSAKSGPVGAQTVKAVSGVAAAANPPASGAKPVEKAARSWLDSVASVIDQLRDNPVIQAVLALLLIVPLLLLWLARRRRANEQEIDDYAELEELPADFGESRFPLEFADQPVQLDKFRKPDKAALRADPAQPVAEFPVRVSGEENGKVDSLPPAVMNLSIDAETIMFLSPPSENLNQDSRTSEPLQEPLLTTPVRSAASNVLEFSPAALANPAEIGVKLDLAKAYIEMGDSEGAQNILNEVISQGNEAQRQEARLLLLKAG